MIDVLKWLYPGIGIKRWIVLLLLGFTVLLLGCAGLVSDSLPDLVGRITVVYQYLPLAVPALLSVLLIVLGAALIVLAARYLVKSILDAYLPDGRAASRSELLDTLMERNVLSKGPRIVAIGGGTGLATILAGLRELSSNITAIVTVADNGGSSGRLRAMDLPAPGDIRNCILALANAGEPMKTLFNYRFKDEVASEGLRGHNFGNLLIATLTQITGDFTEAVKMACRILDVRGMVLPATSASDVHVCAECADGSVICGETQVGKTTKSIVRAFLQPEDCPPTPDALAAIAEADLIVIGPGSLYTSIIATLLVPGIAQAVIESGAHKVYICNAMTQVAETLGYSAYDHVQALLKHTAPGLIDTILVNTAAIKPAILRRYHAEGADVVSVDSQQLAALGVEVIADDFVEQHNVVRHDPKKVSWHLANILWRKRGEAWRFDFGS